MVRAFVPGQCIPPPSPLPVGQLRAELPSGSRDGRARFTSELGLDELAADSRLTTNTDRMHCRDWLVPAIAAACSALSTDELLQACEASDIAFGPVSVYGASVPSGASHPALILLTDRPFQWRW